MDVALLTCIVEFDFISDMHACIVPPESSSMPCSVVINIPEALQKISAE